EKTGKIPGPILGFGPEVQEIRQRYEAMTLDQLKAESDKMNIAYPKTEKKFQWINVLIYVLTVIGRFLFGLFALMVYRVFLEILIVLFNISEKANETVKVLKALYSQGKSFSRP